MGFEESGVSITCNLFFFVFSICDNHNAQIQQLPICDCVLFYIIRSFFPDLIGDELYLFMESSDCPMIVRSLAC